MEIKLYSYEIQYLMEIRDYILYSYEYLEAFNPLYSTQIARLKYEPFGDYYECWTMDNYYWKFKVKKKEGN